ncbi:MAG: hypothetical protein DUD27_06755 [Lachnospiraceae bacterium]|uniref:tRNA(Met) cytidine acetate ligase n=1 Tax=Candidatus Weimeria bifida TaxID=2599074 RepID=A0A6N7J252_9FIRM|nr:hypothetical protein [Candidatus Weimeria bifida]RRF95966.1 MAG: hypothetical protein DUD27_06755 [Lachnospiraceae bacterium]
MSRIGIVAEFNPFHTGHKYIIDYAKNVLGADSVIIALGNEFTQRGGIAIIDRYSRAKAAVDAGADLVVGMPAASSSGADLVIGMPVAASCASAEIFAECGVCLLAACGCDKIACGFEGGDISLFKKTAKVLLEEPAAFKDVLQADLKSGMSFPSAREDALKAYFNICSASVPAKDTDASAISFDDAISEIVSSPNNILAVEYEKAILRHHFDIELIPVKRQGTSYNDALSDGEFVSATYIRRMIYDGNLDAVKKHLTAFSYQALKDSRGKNLLLCDDDLSLPLHLALLSHDNYSEFSDVSEELSDRIKRLLPQFTGFTQFTMLLKNKSLTASRIRRALIHILLGIRDKDIFSLREKDFVPYLWILDASPDGLSMLKGIKKSCSAPLFFSVNELPNGFTDNRLDMKALDLVRALRIEKSGLPIPNERQRKITF